MAERRAMPRGNGKNIFVREVVARRGSWGGGVLEIGSAADPRLRFYPAGARFLSVNSRLKL
jgi:hypothetical protein